VSLFFRDGANVEIERPDVETFAENIGLLTRDIFRVELNERWGNRPAQLVDS
jgi:hypothetical protein